MRIRFWVGWLFLVGLNRAYLLWGARNQGACGASQVSRCLCLSGVGGGELDVDEIDILTGYGGVSRV